MTRRHLLTLPLALAACSRQREAQEPFFASTVGPWILQSTKDLQAEDMPDQVRRAGPRRGGSAVYTQGSSTLHVQKYELTGSASGLDLEQNWRPAPSTVAFHRDVYFYVVRWEGDRAAVTSFTRELLK